MKKYITTSVLLISMACGRPVKPVFGPRASTGAHTCSYIGAKCEITFPEIGGKKTRQEQCNYGFGTETIALNGELAYFVFRENDGVTKYYVKSKDLPKLTPPADSYKEVFVNSEDERAKLAKRMHREATCVMIDLVQ